MNYIYTTNLYKNDKKIHSEQLISVGNYKSLYTLLVDEDELDKDNNILIISKSVHKLFRCHDLFINEILSDLFATTDCVDEITGDVKEGFKLTVEVEEHEQD